MGLLLVVNVIGFVARMCLCCVCVAIGLLICLWFVVCVSVWILFVAQGCCVPSYCGFVDFCCLVVDFGLLIVLIVFLCIVSVYFVWL